MSESLTKAQRSQWAEIQRSKQTNRCRCDLRPGMDWEALRALGAGCTHPRWCCPTLDHYRRVIGGPPSYEEAA